ncbi:MAG TPA: alanine--tRNA ligase, partial [Terriglobales bacterium]|nr:alanine--tRNA ligase [Terriglobales bacterium]
MLTGSEIREKFLKFFEEKGHRRVHSSSLVPHNDPTLLFTNAGMNQFKDVFLGLEKRDYSRATTSQKCVRAGGKHNDLENVGFTNRHHTFFEMLGNFSFGDYFKKDAIAYAWELITSPKWFGLTKDKLYVTIFEGTALASGTSEGIPRDDEAEKFWLDVDVPKERIFAMGMKDNFWQMGDTGPCGPCSEIYYDMGVASSDQGHTDCAFPCDCGRYVEIWNLVFMQYNREQRTPDGTLFGLNPLPKPSIDTGMGLERTTAALQGVISNYDTDLFTPLIKRAAELTNTTAIKTGHVGTGASPVQAEQSSAATPGGTSKSAASLRVIADHSRAAMFLISDGVLPSNEGRGYVLRKIIRRAITHGRLLGQTKPFLYEMIFAVRDLMQDAYPELKETADRVSKTVHVEETRFAHTLDIGLRKLEDLLEAATKGFDKTPDKVISDIAGGATSGELTQIRNRAHMLDGQEAFKLYDTFGMPLDFMQDAARDRGIVFDEAGFEAAMNEQRTRARASWKGAAKQTANPAYQQLPKSDFEGYRQTRSENCEVLAIIHKGQGAKELKAGDEGEIILDHTPFYAESGGQVGDRGSLYSDEQNAVMAEVKGCYYPVQGVRAHQVIAKQPIRVGDKVDAVVSTETRQATMRNHTATHLLQAGLREVLGKHVKQAG